MFRYLFDAGELGLAQTIANQAIAICTAAVSQDGIDKTSQIKFNDVLAKLYDVLAAVENELQVYDRALELWTNVKSLREECLRMENAQDADWIAAADGNIAVALMGLGRTEEALALLRSLVGRKDVTTDKDVKFGSLFLCLSVLGYDDQALGTSEVALNITRQERGEDDLQVSV